MTKCPYCAEEIQAAAIVCKHCGRDMQGGAVRVAPASGLRIAFLVVGVLALMPLTFLFGLYGFVTGLFFLLLAAFAK